MYATRFDALKELTDSIPPDEHVIGFLKNGDDPETSLWLPFGARQVVEVTPWDSMEDVKVKGIHFVVIDEEGLTDRYHTTIALLAAKWSGSIVTKKQIMLKAHRGPGTWYLLSL